jgi:hypothetical protein
MKDYIRSEAFQNTTFAAGWERLFLKYWRRQLLKDTGREKDILRDEQGREYYQAWKYTLPSSNSRSVSFAVTMLVVRRKRGMNYYISNPRRLDSNGDAKM